MKVHADRDGVIHIDLSNAEAMVLLEELETVRGGAKCVKLRQVCEGIKSVFTLDTLMRPSKAAVAQRAKPPLLSIVKNGRTSDPRITVRVVSDDER